MTTFRNLMLAGALLIAAPGYADDAHHPPEAQPVAPPAAAPAPPPAAAAPVPGGPQGMPGQGMPGQGMPGSGMMGMMGQGGICMMGSGDPGMGMMGGAGPGAMAMGQMMDPARIERRIAFLKAELGITDAQQPLWNALADALRANRATMGDMQQMMAAQDGGAPTLLQLIESHERMLAVRLEAVRRLRAALGPLYAAFDETQKRTADQLMMLGAMGPM